MTDHARDPITGSTPSPAAILSEHFADRLSAAIDRRGTPACVGLDPVLDKLPPSLKAHTPAAAIAAFCTGVIDAVAHIVPAVKPQSACFERYGHEGVAALEAVIAHARAAGLLVILDAKRGDIGVSADHYAAAAFGPANASTHADISHHADALTASPYLGPDTLTPLLRRGRGLFVLVRTSNPGSDAVQSARLSDGRTVAELIADQTEELGRTCLGARGLSCVGAVVGATKASDAAELRARMPSQIFLIPGYGAQGGTLEDLRPTVRPVARSVGELGVLVNASRSVLYPPVRPGESWIDAVRAAAQQFADDLRGLMP